MRNPIVTLALALSFVASLAGADPAPPLDGKAFTGTMTTGKSVYKDTFLFAKGRFDSTTCHGMGFGDGPYTAAADGAFEADTESKTEGRIHWKGVVKGKRLEATAVRTKEGEAPVTYTILGSLKK